MAYRIGAKGQVVIARAIRDALGIGPGWTIIQRVVDGRVELSFVPPEQQRSLRGILRGQGTPATAPGQQDAAWAAIAREGEAYHQQHGTDDGVA